MAEVSKWNGADSSIDCCSLPMNSVASASAGRKTRPGLVQNWPAPWVSEAYSPAAMLCARSRSAPGRMKTGFVLLISAKTGIGSGRAAATSISILPAVRDPVKPAAFTSGCLIKSSPHPVATIEQKRKNSLRQLALTDGLLHGVAHQFAGAGMRRMRLEDDWISCRKGRSCVPARNRKCQGKVTGTENDDRAQRPQHGANIGSQSRLAF